MSSSSSHTARTSTKLAMWEGFGDELQKIAMNMARPMKPAPMTGLMDVKKTVYNQKSALTTRKPSYTKVHTDPPMQMPRQDPLSGSKTIPPPPVTTGGL